MKSVREALDRSATDSAERPPAETRTGASLFLRVAAFVFCSSAAIVIALATVSFFAAQWIIRQQVEQRLHLAATQRAQAIDMYVRQQHELAQLVATRTRLRRQMRRWNLDELSTEQFRDEAGQILLDAMQGANDFAEISLTDISGRIVASTDPRRVGDDLAELESFKLGQLMPFLSEFRMTDSGLQTMLSVPAKDMDERLLGVVVITLQSSSLQRVISNPAGLGITGEALMGCMENPDQVKYLLPQPGAESTHVAAARVPSMVKAIEGHAGFERTEYDGQDVLIAYHPVEYQPHYRSWGLVVKLNVSEAFTPLQNLRRIVLPLALLLLVPAVVSSYWLASRHARPIMRLAESAAELARGNLGHRVTVADDDEIGMLSRAFNDMADRLETQYEDLETRVQSRTEELSLANAELARSNRELEQFAYVASHDLQEPLRAISGFARLLRDQGGDLTDQGREYLEFVTDGAERMKLLIDNLLEYSRVRSQGAPLESIDSGLALNDALANLAPLLESSGANVTRSGLGLVLADRGQLTQVFQNLISNAVKFSQDGQPQIDIRADYGDEKVTFSVRDNGIGIDPKDYNRIFTIFQRLHSREAYAGTGIGLAICQQIVLRHHGKIWVQSNADDDSGDGNGASQRGSTFFFTLCVPPSPTRS